MKIVSKEFALFIDGIRIERGLSRLDLTEDIISLSQYKRYLRGAASIPNDIVLELANKLRYNISDLYALYTRKHSREDNELREIYNLILSYNYDEAYKSLMDVKDELIVSSAYKSFYDYMVILTQHHLGRVSDVHVLSMYSELIDYPNCMKNDSFDFVEIASLQQIVVISSKMENYEPADSFYEVLSSGNLNYIKSDQSGVLPSIYYTVARVFYKQEKYNETLRLINEGIDKAISEAVSNALPHLFLLGAIVMKHLGKLDESRVMMKKCFMQLIILDDDDKFNTFKNSYTSYFDEPIEELFKDISDLIK